MSEIYVWFDESTREASGACHYRLLDIDHSLKNIYPSSFILTCEDDEPISKERIVINSVEFRHLDKDNKLIYRGKGSDVVTYLTKMMREEFKNYMTNWCNQNSFISDLNNEPVDEFLPYDALIVELIYASNLYNLRKDKEVENIIKFVEVTNGYIYNRSIKFLINNL